jgi:hypothetical protein
MSQLLRDLNEAADRMTSEQKEHARAELLRWTTEREKEQLLRMRTLDRIQ